MCDTSSACQNHAIFPRFNQLPTELRLRIWEFALPDERLVIIKQRWNGKHKENPLEAPWLLRSTCPRPSFFKVCHESATVARRHYSLGFGMPGISCNSEIYFDYERDILYLDQSTFQERNGFIDCTIPVTPARYLHELESSTKQHVKRLALSCGSLQWTARFSEILLDVPSAEQEDYDGLLFASLMDILPHFAAVEELVLILDDDCVNETLKDNATPGKIMNEDLVLVNTELAVDNLRPYEDQAQEFGYVSVRPDVIGCIIPGLIEELYHYNMRLVLQGKPPINFPNMSHRSITDRATAQRLENVIARFGRYE